MLLDYYSIEIRKNENGKSDMEISKEDTTVGAKSIFPIVKLVENQTAFLVHVNGSQNGIDIREGCFGCKSYKILDEKHPCIIDIELFEKGE